MNERNKQIRRRDAGFTLIEILLVVVIIGMLAAVAGMKLTGKMGVAQKNIAKQGIAVIEQAIDLYEIENSRLPDSLQSLLTKSSVSGTAYLKKAEGLKDPWGTEYQYTRQGNDFSVVSAGQDLNFGSADDIK